MSNDAYEKTMSNVMDDTIFCWKQTRLHGHSASMVSDGVISVELLNFLDAMAKSGEYQRK